MLCLWLCSESVLIHSFHPQMQFQIASLSWTPRRMVPREAMIQGRKDSGPLSTCENCGQWDVVPWSGGFTCAVREASWRKNLVFKWCNQTCILKSVKSSVKGGQEGSRVEAGNQGIVSQSCERPAANYIPKALPSASEPVCSLGWWPWEWRGVGELRGIEAAPLTGFGGTWVLGRGRRQGQSRLQGDWLRETGLGGVCPSK